jgi:PEGA domain
VAMLRARRSRVPRLGGQRLRARWLRASVGLTALALMVLVAAFAAPSSLADTLKVTSSPAGAKVEIDGVLVGTTPYKTSYPGGYFHKPHTVFAARLGHAMVVRIYKEGYASQETTITEGPFEWVDLKGHSRGRYWLVKADEVQATLRPLSKNSAADPRAGPMPAKINDVATERPAEKTPDARAFSAISTSRDSETGVLLLSAETAEAEIYIDGKFVGGTPATISLATGAHQITMKAAGKKDWTREINVMKGSQVTLHATFDQLQ